LRFSPGMARDQQVEAFTALERGRCSDEYFSQETKQARVDDVVAAVRAISVQPWAGKILLVGHSEGTHVVTGVLARTGNGDYSGSVC
jgi:hypothetical protein